MAERKCPLATLARRVNRYSQAMRCGYPKDSEMKLRAGVMF
jgi:hypothetical protein